MITLSSLSDRPVAVLGLGRSGLATARALVESRIPVWAWDDNVKARNDAENEGIPLVDLYQRDLSETDALVLSPGIPLTHPSPHPLLKSAREAGCDVIGDGELLFKAQPEAFYIGITGTNGKSTTTALIGHILQSAARDCEIGGNLGTPMLSLRPLGADSVYVLEMSSFQLELNPSMVFDVAVLLNISPDHLDRHGDMDGYVAAKRLIFRDQGPDATAVVGVDDDYSRAIFAGLPETSRARRVAVSGYQRAIGGVYAEERTLYDDTGAGDPRPVFGLDLARALPGEHNAQNASAAYAAARATGIESKTTCDALRTFPGLAHRQEVVAVIDGVAYVNDSKATNPEAAARALACYQNIYWIVGGRPKEGGLGPVDPFLKNVRHAFLIGEAMDTFAVALDGQVHVSRSGDLETAVGAARSMAGRDGEDDAVVLLSPACASFDQFKSFEVRGDAFRSHVEAFKQ